MYVDCYAPGTVEQIDTLDALRCGLRNKIKMELGNKKRRTKGEYRHTVGNKIYWHNDDYGNPELIWQGHVLARLLYDGARLDFPPFLGQQSVNNRLWQHVLKPIGWSMAYRKVGTGYVMGIMTTKNAGWKWGGEAGEHDEFMRFESNMIVPYRYKL